MKPLVSIGMPVFNGEQYVGGALASLLAQDYSDFELLISDNASTDGTAAICEEIQSKDQRVRFIRHPENRGAPWNFAFLAEEAKGEYFMWAAHDDLWAPNFVGACLAKLQASPGALLCCTEIQFIDAAGRPHAEWSKKDYTNIETAGMTPVQRIHELIARMGWFAFYGLMRRESARGLSSGLSIVGGDVLFLLDLLLAGDVVKVPEKLFSYRIVKSRSPEDHEIEFNSEKTASGATRTPRTDLAVQLFEKVCRSALADQEKLEVFADFIFTLTCSNDFWRREITKELTGAGANLSDDGFAALLTVALSRAVPLAAFARNPVLQEVFSKPMGNGQFLKTAARLRSRAFPAQAELGEEAYRKGVELFNQGKSEEAAAQFTASLAANQTSDRWHDWAVAQIAAGRVADAETGLRRALALQANNHEAALKLGVMLADMGRGREAVGYLAQALPFASGRQRREILQLLLTSAARATG